MNFYRRNGRQMVLTPGEEEDTAKPERETNGSRVCALANAYLWQE